MVLRVLMLCTISIFLMFCQNNEGVKDYRSILKVAIQDTKNLINNSSIGNREGQFTVTGLTNLNKSLKVAESLSKKSEDANAHGVGISSI